MYQRRTHSLQKTADIRLDRKAHFPYICTHFYMFFVVVSIYRQKNLFCTIYFGISHIRTELFLSKKRETLIFVLTTTYTHTHSSELS